jgi:hypothetical protein
MQELEFHIDIIIKEETGKQQGVGSGEVSQQEQAVAPLRNLINCPDPPPSNSQSLRHQGLPSENVDLTRKFSRRQGLSKFIHSQFDFKIRTLDLRKRKVVLRKEKESIGGSPTRNFSFFTRGEKAFIAKYFEKFIFDKIYPNSSDVRKCIKFICKQQPSLSQSLHTLREVNRIRYYVCRIVQKQRVDLVSTFDAWFKKSGYSFLADGLKVSNIHNIR